MSVTRVFHVKILCYLRLGKEENIYHVAIYHVTIYHVTL